MQNKEAQFVCYVWMWLSQGAELIFVWSVLQDTVMTLCGTRWQKETGLDS